MNWRDYVREHLPPLDVPAERESEIVDELAGQLEATFDRARAAARSRGGGDGDGRTPKCRTGRRWPPRSAASSGHSTRRPPWARSDREDS